MAQSIDHLLRQVAGRKRLASFSNWFFRCFLVAASLYLVLFILARLLSLIPDHFELWTVAIVPAAALLGALIFHRGVTASEAARMVDVRMKSKDLFITAATLDTAAGEYQELITHDAQAQAAAIAPAQVVPFQGWNQSAIVAMTLGLLLLGAWLLPTFDPFAQKQTRQRIAERISKLEKEKIAAKEKIEALKEKDVDAKVSKEVEKALAELKKSFEQMKKTERETNLARLNEQQKNISDKWRQAQEKKLKDTSPDKLAQQLGGSAGAIKARDWKEDLEQGKTESLKKELQEIKELVEKAQNAKTEEEKKESQKEAQQRMQELSEFAKNQAGGKEMNQSLQKALEQLAQAKDPAAQKQAMEAMKESMKLSEQQMEQLAQAIRDQKSLEEAMQSIQNAKQANAQDQLDGQEAKDAQTLREYAEKLREKLNGSASNESGDGDGGQGGKSDPNNQQAKGDGGKDGKNGGGKGGLKAGDQPGSNHTPAQDISGSSAFRTEKSKSALQAGKSLMQWKTQEVTDAGEAKVTYREAVEKVKQGVSEAILQEQIPPGYHETIQKYFDEVGGQEKAKKQESGKAKNTE